MAREYAERPCEVCGALHRRRGRTCSSRCAAELRSQVNRTKVLTCVLCGKEFRSKDGKGKYCSGPHVRSCVICGREYVIPVGKEAHPSPTCGPHCGAVLSHRNPASKTKRKTNSLSRWGTEFPSQAPDVRQRIRENPNSASTRFGSERMKEILEGRYGTENVSSLEDVKRRKHDTFNEHYTSKGIFISHGPVSKTNLRWKAVLEDATGLSWELEHRVDGVGSIDLYAELDGVALPVEINPTATHNSYVNRIGCVRKGCDTFPCSTHATKRMYHHDRAKAVHVQGMSLLSVFNWMDERKVVDFVRARLRLNEVKVGARQTEVVRLTQAQANAFMKEFHMMGSSRGQTFCYGLVLDGSLVHVQTFAPSGRDGACDGVFEARRLASRAGVTVVGGASRLTQHFIREAHPSRIVAFSDLDLSWPNYDETFNNFAHATVNGPQKCWSKGSRMILDKSAARQSADRLIGVAHDSKHSPYPEDWTNEQVLLAEGWLPVYDCGMLKDIWQPA